MASAIDTIFSAISRQPRTIDILGIDYEEHVKLLGNKISNIQRYRAALVLDNKKIWSWYMDLQDVMYAAIDALDVYSIAVEEKGMGIMKERLNNILYDIFKDELIYSQSSLTLAGTAKILNKKIDELLEQGNACGYQDWIEFKSKKYPGRSKPTWTAPVDPPIIGRDGVRNDIMRWLEDEHTEGSLRILPVVGMGGIGKTALLRSLFSSVTHYFHLCGWVQCPYEGIDVGPLLANIRSQFEGVVPSQTLRPQELTTLLRDKKFLLVIDDVWSKKQQWWVELLKPLKSGNAGSKLLITTRDMEVVKAITICYGEGVEAEVKLECLTDDVLWEILKNYVFGVNEPVLGCAETIGKKIVTKLTGLPLAAVAIGCLLIADRWSQEHWESIANCDLWDLLKSKDDMNLVPTLTRSFLHLSTEAKLCFTYCSLLAGNARSSYAGILPPVIDVVYQWLAHGYLQVQDEESVEDVGESMVNYLESMSLLSKNINTHDSPFRTTVKNHLFCDASRASGRNDHLQMIDDRNIDKLPVGTLRHLCISTERWKLTEESLEKLGNCKKLRTLIVEVSSGYKNAYGISRILRLWFEKLKSLRVLTLANLGICELPNEIGELKHLRYLNLSGNSIKCLPGTMAELHHLQVLKLSRLEVAEASCLGKLTKLRYLAFSLCKFRSLGFITLLSDLQVLSLRGCWNVTELPDGISNLKRLECLELECDGIRKLPEGLASLSSLRFLYICDGHHIKITLPSNFNDMKNLSRLHLPDYLLHSISGIGKLTSLQNLGEFRIQEKEGHKIEELADLNMLCEKLKIQNLDLVKSNSEAQRSQLEQKVKLQELELHWKPDDNGTRDVIIEEAIIEGLKPSRDLKGLTIENYIGRKLPSWLISEHLRLLKRWCLSGLLNIDLIEGLVLAPSKSNKRKRSQRVQEIFPFMEELELSNLPKLTGWRGANNRDQWIFPCLRKIKIYNCPMLKSIPAIPLSLEYMRLNCVGLSELPRLHFRSGPVVLSSPSPRSSAAQVASLAYVEIQNCSSLLSLNHGFLEQQLPNLRELFINSCENLRHPLHNGFRDFESLESLKLTDCPILPKLSIISDPALPAQLRHLTIKNCTNLETESLQKSLKTLTSLQGLHVEDCCPQMSISIISISNDLWYLTIKNCTNLDPWIFPRLRKIKIHNCPMIKSMPAIPLSLEYLELDNVGLSELPRLHFRSGPVVFSSPSAAQVASLAYVEIQNCPSLLSLNHGFLEQQWPNLRQLFIKSCENLRHPLHNGFRDFESLESLKLTDCPMLRQLSLTSDPALPPHLRRLTIKNCTNLETESVQKSLKALTSLEFLQVEDCCRQMSISFIKSAVALHLKTIRVCKIKVGDCYLEISMYDRTERLLGEDDENDASGGEEATEEREQGCSCTELLAVMFRNIPSVRIEDLYLYGEDSEERGNYNTRIYLNDLESLPVHISRFSSLKELHIDSCDNFCPPDEGWALVEPGEAFLGLTSVKILKISNCNRLRSLPYSSFLKRLEVTQCDALVNISSLGSPMPYIKMLAISSCANLENPPERGFMMLGSLRKLILIKCPKLSKLSEKEQYSDLPACLSVLRIKGCKRLQFEHIQYYISDLKALRMLTVMNCGGCVTKSFITRVLGLFRPENPFQCRIMSTELAFEWMYEGDPIKRSTVSWIVRSEEDTGDLSNSQEFLVEMLETMSRYNIENLTISGIHELDVIEGKMKEILLGLTGLLYLTIANCRNLGSLPVADIARRITTFKALHIDKCSKLPLLDPNQVPYAITQVDESYDEESDREDEDEESDREDSDREDEDEESDREDSDREDEDWEYAEEAAAMEVDTEF